MPKAIRKFLPLIAFCAIWGTHGQNLNAVILDSATQAPVPFVTVQLKNKGMITNEEGRFNFQLNKAVLETDSLFISCIGYESIRKPLKEFTQAFIYLNPKAIELDPVIVTNKNYTPEEIVEHVKNNLGRNYHLGLSKKRLFLRETYTNNIIKTDYKLVESSIEAFNKRFLDSVLRTIPKSNTYYTEMLGDLYGGSDNEQQKLDLIKASELYDKSMELDFEALEEKFNKIVKENVKTDSYFKIKSGIFGTKVDADELFSADIDSTDVAALNKSIEEAKKNKEERKKFFAKYKRRTLGNLYKNLPIYADSDYNVLFKARKYELTLEDFTYLGDDAVYVIRFEPKRSADFRGKLFINSDDFALIRIDFENTEPLRKFNLLGISMNEYLAKGRILFAKGDDQLYHLRYYDITKGTRVGIKRPVKIIEKNKNVKGRRKQNELSLKIDAAFGNTNKYELVVFDENMINMSQYEAFKENNTVLPTFMPNYDPEFWSGYDIISPNQAIKEFTSQVQTSD